MTHIATRRHMHHEILRHSNLGTMLERAAPIMYDTPARGLQDGAARRRGSQSIGKSTALYSTDGQRYNL